MGEVEEVMEGEEVACPDCEGTGFVQCDFCDGSGRVDAGYRAAVLEYEARIIEKMERRTSRGGQDENAI